MSDATRSVKTLPTAAAQSAVAEIARLRAQLDVQTAVIRAQSAFTAERRDTFERASEAARIGFWECSLPDERLTWTGVVYDLFDLPRHTDLDRSRILHRYTEASRQILTAVRNRAIARAGSFSLDAEIRTPAGASRWLRLTARVDTVRGVPVRLFGTKQDVTADTLRLDDASRLAVTDPLTGLANRRRFEAALEGAAGTLVLVDLDGFKAVNDTFGHTAGDACLKESALRLSELCRKADLVARIGGDEFAILIAERLSVRASAALAGRVVAALRRPIHDGDRSFRIGASVGVACAAIDPCSLFARADAALYAAKAAGRNTFRIDPTEVAPGVRSVAGLFRPSAAVSPHRQPRDVR